MPPHRKRDLRLANERIRLVKNPGSIINFYKIQLITLWGKRGLSKVAEDHGCNTLGICSTLIDRRFRMLQIRGIKGEAVVIYCEPLITKEMGYHKLSIN
jgi:hypothetical protein